MENMKKAFSLGVLVGRFQGLHGGHIMMIDTALSVCGRVGVLIGSANESGTNKNPFSYETRREMLTRVYGDRIMIAPLDDIGVGNCAAWGEYVIEKAKEHFGEIPDAAVSGKEPRRVAWLEGSTGERIAEIYVPKTVDISASRMREFFACGMREEWERLTPPALHGMYEKLREAVLSSIDNLETTSI